MPGILSEPLDELGEALSIGVEVVRERLLEHLVDHMEVLGDRQSVVVLGDPAYLHSGPLSQDLVGLPDRSAHVEPGPRPAIPRVSKPALLPLVTDVSACVQLGLGQLAQPRQVTADALGPTQEYAGHLVACLAAG